MVCNLVSIYSQKTSTWHAKKKKQNFRTDIDPDICLILEKGLGIVFAPYFVYVSRVIFF